jgi:hypothetical protein
VRLGRNSVGAAGDFDGSNNKFKQTNKQTYNEPTHKTFKHTIIVEELELR